MAGGALAAVVILACAAVSQAQTSTTPAPITFTGISPPKLDVVIESYTIANKTVAAGTPCMAQNPGAACLPQVHAARDKVNIVYNVMTGFAPNLTDSVQLKACYSNFSSVDRPWRAYNNIIAKSKKCPFVIKANLSPVSGNATWKIPNTIPIGTYFIRAFVLKNSTAADGLPQAQVAFGTSVGYFQVVPIDPRTKGLKIAAGCCAVVGPLMFLSYMLVMGVIKKNK